MIKSALMELLVFAHRGEAQTFLKEMDFKSDSDFNDLYTSDKKLLLITKEGPTNVLTRLGFTLGKYPQIENIINYGICGSLEKELPIGSIHSPRTIYMEDEFKSFPSDKDSKIDLITTKKRILNEEDGQTLSNFATLVDREAYAIASVAKEFHRNLKVYKMISDHIEEAEFCERIKENSLYYSEELFKHYETLSNTKNHNKNEVLLLDDDDFYFSLSQKRIFKSLIKANTEKHRATIETILKSVNISELKNDTKKLPKQRTSLLIERLNKHLYPFRTKVIDSLDDLTKDLRKYDCRFKYDKDLERKSFKFEATIDSKEKLELVARTLKSFSWNQFSKIMDGDFDV